MKTMRGPRKHHYMARVGTFLIAVVLIAGMVGCHLFDQNLEIRTWYDLDAIRDNLSGHHIVMNDLDSNTAGYEELASPTANEGSGWAPIVVFYHTHGYDGFTGTFDGRGYEIRDLFINYPGAGPVGLFGMVDGVDGVIKNVGVVNITVTGGGIASAVAGGLVGTNSGTVSNCYSTGNVSGGHDPTILHYVGGLVGSNHGTVSDCYSTSSVTGDDYVGGLVGDNQGSVRNCYSTGSVTGSTRVGGLVGVNYEIVSDCYSTGSVTGNSSVGGLVGWNGCLWIHNGTVSNCYATGVVSGSDQVGGLVGYNGGSVSNSFWDTETSGQATSAGGTGKTTGEMKSITTFSGAGWTIIAVARPSTRNPSYIWNIVDGQTYPFLSWQAVS